MTIFDIANNQLQEISDTLQNMRGVVEERQREFMELQRSFDLSGIDPEALELFTHKPYILRPAHVRGNADVFELIIPRFIDFRAGWPVRTEGEYVIYQVSRFIDLITPLPAWLRGELGYTPPAFGAHLDGEWLVVDHGNPEEAFQALGGSHSFVQRRGERLHLTARSRFDVLRNLVRMGILPYTPQAIHASLLRASSGKVILRPEQERDFQTFLKYSAVSVFATGGSGKTFFGLYAIDVFPYRKIVLAPRRSILEQWEARIRSFCPHALSEMEFHTYQSLKSKPLTGDYSLVIYDEIQHMPADMGMRASQIRSSARIGLSATPWREDGKEDIIPALCGIPVGMDWPSQQPPETIIWLVDAELEKLDLAEQLVKTPTRAKTMLFVYRLVIGEKLAKRLKVPFISGGTSKQYKAIQDAKTFVISKVGDAGVSVDVSRIIEVDWLGGRAELGQRGLRGQHAREKGEFHILMTKREYKDSSRRLSALYALNFDVKVQGA